MPPSPADLAIVTSIVSKALPNARGIEAGTLAADVQGWDSHATVEIIFTLEDRYGFQMTSAQMERVKGVADLLVIVAAHRGAGAAALCD